MSLIEIVAGLKENEAVSYIKEALEKGTDPLMLIEEGQKGMEIVGNKFRDNQYFLPELLIAAQMFSGIMETLAPHIKTKSKETLGKIVLGTVKGDLHDIGKNIFKTISEANGFTVYDLGVDVPAEKFVETTERENADIVAMSGLLTTVFSSMRNVVEILEEKGMRNKVKVVLGGAPMDEGVQKLVGADAWTRNASNGVDICKELLGKN
ncbi:MAG: corrinoid protein [Dehalobacterium sp.]